MTKRKREAKFDLVEADLGAMRDLAGEDAELLIEAKKLFDSQLAAGTIDRYNRIIKEFREFCDEDNTLSYENFSAKEVGRFIVKNSSKNRGEAFWGAVKPAIEAVQKARNVPAEDTAFTTIVMSCLAGAKRRAAEIRPPVKKMMPLPEEALVKALEVYIYQHVPDNLERIDLSKFRTIFRWTITKYTMCRWDGYDYLKAKHFSLSQEGNDLFVMFPRSKADQTGKGKKCTLATREHISNPVALTLLYFKLFGLKMDEEDESKINCALRYTRQGLVPKRDEGLSYNEGVKQAKKLLEDMGFSSEGYGESSAKRAGVTEPLERGATVEQIQLVGGWKTPGMPLYYAAMNEKFKIELAQKMYQKK